MAPQMFRTGGEPVLDMVPRRDMLLVIFEHAGQRLPRPGRHSRVLRQRAHARDQGLNALHIEYGNAGLVRTLVDLVPIPLHRLIKCACIGPGRCAVRPSGWPGMNRGWRRIHATFRLRLRCRYRCHVRLRLQTLRRLRFRLALDPMHMPHDGRAPVAACPVMEFLEGVELLDANAVAFGKQGGEVRRAGAESFGLFQQHAMTGKRFAEGAPERHGIALGAGLFAQVVVCGQNLSPARRRRRRLPGHDASGKRCAGFLRRCEPARCRSRRLSGFRRPGCWLAASQAPPAGPAIRRRRYSRAPLPWAGSATSALPDAPGCPNP